MKRLLLSSCSRAMLVMLVGVATLTTGCRLSGEEVAPVPLSAENPLDLEVYYVSGTLTNQAGSGISGVTVIGGSESATTNGSGYYELTIEASDAGEANTALTSGVEFDFPSTYVGDKSVPALFPSGAEKGARLTVNHTISTANGAIAVDASDLYAYVDVYVDGDNVSTNYIEDAAIVTFTSGVQNVAITPYIPAATKSVLELAAGSSETKYYAPSVALAIDLGSSTLSANIELSIPRSSSSILSTSKSNNGYYFSTESAKVMIYKDGDWTYGSRTVALNNGYYSFWVSQSDDVDGLTSFRVGLAPEIEVKVGSAETAELATKVINNYNNADVVTESYTYNKYVGLVEESFTIGGSDLVIDDTLKAEMKAYLETLLGATIYSTAGMESVSDKAVVSGDTKVTVTYTQNYSTYTITAQVQVGEEGTSLSAEYTAKYYGVVNRTVKSDTGNLSK